MYSRSKSNINDSQWKCIACKIIQLRLIITAAIFKTDCTNKKMKKTTTLPIYSVFNTTSIFTVIDKSHYSRRKHKIYFNIMFKIASIIELERTGLIRLFYYG